MKRASYREAVSWLADRDDPGELAVDTLTVLPTVILVAHLFGVDPERVERDIHRRRGKDDPGKHEAYCALHPGHLGFCHDGKL